MPATTGALPAGVLAVLAVPVLAAGLLTGTAGLVLHTRWWALGLAAAATAAALAALPPGWWLRPAFALGWEVPVLGAGLGTGPGGDVVVTTDLAGYTLLVLALVVALVPVLTLPARRRPAAPAGRDESATASTSA